MVGPMARREPKSFAADVVFRFDAVWRGQIVTDYSLPNPFMFLPGEKSGEAAAYSCCHDCGKRAPCDQYCPNARAIEERLFEELREIAQTFEIEAVPEFISRARRSS
jgi:hypothetical protein